MAAFLDVTWCTPTAPGNQKKIKKKTKKEKKKRKKGSGFGIPPYTGHRGTESEGEVA